VFAPFSKAEEITRNLTKENNSEKDMEEGTELPALPAVPTKSQKGHTDIAGPTNESNWVIPGKVLAGAYPGDRKEPLHSEKIEQIVSTGKPRQTNKLLLTHNQHWEG